MSQTTPMNEPLSITIVTPVYHDWQSFKQLVADIDRVLIDQSVALTLIAVNGDLQMFMPDNLSEHFTEIITPESCIRQIELVHVVRNVGHQRAIALGLVSLRDSFTGDAIIVMDADGEDRPQDLITLIEAFQQHPQKIIVAQRRKRQESWRFRLFYKLYKLIYRLITNQYIDFGNYMLIPAAFYEALIHDSNLWNHLAASVQRGFTTIHKIPTDRGKRYAGQSKMNFQSLFIHGLSAISVYLDVVAIRAVIALALFTSLALIGLVLMFAVALLSDYSLPVWLTNAVVLLVIVGFQSLLLAMGAMLMILNQRSSKKIIPALEVDEFIKEQETIFMKFNKQKRI